MDIPLVQNLEGQLAAFAPKAHRDLLREECRGGPPRRFIKFAISIAATPASYPRFTLPAPGDFAPSHPEPAETGSLPMGRAPSRPPDRASACSSVSVVSTPKMTGIP